MPTLTFINRNAAEAIRLQEQINDKARDLKNIYQDDARAARELEKAATRIFKNSKQPAEQYNAEMGKLLNRFRDGKVNAEQYAKGMRQLEDAYKRTQTLGGKLQQQTDKLFGAGAISRLAKYAASFYAIQKALSAVASEIRSAIELSEKAAAAQLTVSQSRNVVIRNLAGQSQDTIKKVLEQNAALAKSSGVSEVAINAARAEALSASGGNIEASLSATKIAAQFLPDQPGSIGGFAGSLLDLSKVTGTQDAAVNLGLLTQVASLSRVVDPQQQAANIPRALIGATSFGSTGSGAAALFSALTTGSGDITGARSGTATIQLAKQLSEFLGETDGTELAKLEEKRTASLKQEEEASERLRKARVELNETDTSGDRRIADAEQGLKDARQDGDTDRIKSAKERLRRAQVDRARDRADKQANFDSAKKDFIEQRGETRSIDDQIESLKSQAEVDSKTRDKFQSLNTNEKIQFLQNNPELAQAFLADASFEAIALGPIQQLLLDKNSDVAQQLRSNLTSIPGNEGLKKLAGKTLDSFAANELNVAAEADRQLSSFVEQERAQGDPLLTAEGRENLIEILQRTSGRFNLTAKGKAFLGGLKDGTVGLSVADAAAVLREEATAARYGYNEFAPALEGTVGAGEQQATADKLDKVAAILEASLEEQKATNAKIGEGGIVVSGE